MSVVEVLNITDTIRHLIITHASAGEIKAAAIEEGMKTLRKNALQKAIAGETTLEEVLRVTAAD